MEPDSTYSRREILTAGLGVGALSMLAGCGGGNAPQSAAATPVEPLPAVPAPSSGPIASLAIHPAIGVARVGNSASEFFLGQEAVGQLAVPAGGFKDAQGALKRQGARFRIYGYDVNGALVREVTAQEATITWTVHVANAKGAWYNFETALDVPVAEPTTRRNSNVTGQDRSALVIDPGPRSISGLNSSGIVFDGGTFLGHPVPLGELRTDDAGRLIVLGGHGTSLSPAGLPLTTFADNEGWCDDTSDGPVQARVVLNGQTFDATPSWVVVAPPNYGPSISAGYVTMYDIIYDVMRRNGLLPDRPVSFADDIYPLFARLVDMQWLNAGILRDNGPGTSGDFTAADYIAALSDPSPQNAGFRRQVFSMFRNPNYATVQAIAIPPLYGDEVSVPATTTQQWYTVTSTQYEMLTRWAAGQFYPTRPGLDGPRELGTVPLTLQPEMLDRAALDACLGGAFHPGCEATWPMRIASMYAGRFRLRLRSGPEPDYGDTLTPAAALAPDGPLSASGPGSLSRWMAVPWQADTASCRSGYQPELDPYLPTFWPARVPNHILTQDDYSIVMDPSRSAADRLKAFHTRPLWLRHIIDADKIASITRMVSMWFMLGLVAQVPGPTDLPGVPSVLKVETLNTFTTPPLSKREVFWKWRD